MSKKKTIDNEEIIQPLDTNHAPIHGYEISRSHAINKGWVCTTYSIIGGEKNILKVFPPKTKQIACAYGHAYVMEAK